MITSKSRASRLAEVSNSKKCTGIGPQKQVLPIGAAAKPQSFATRFSEFVVSLPHPFSIVTTASQLFSDHLSSSLCSSFQSCSISPLLSSTLFTSSLLFSTLPNDSHLCPPRLHSSQLFFNSSHLFPPLRNSSHLFLSSSQLFSPSQFWLALLNSSHLLSQRG